MDINHISNKTIVRILAITVSFVLGLYLIYLLRTVLIWIGTAFFLSLALNPAVEYVSKMMPKRSRGMATGVVFLLLFSALGMFIYLFIPPLVEQTQDLLRDLPATLRNLQQSDNFIGELMRRFNAAERLDEEVRNISGFGRLGNRLLDVAGNLFLMMIAAISIFGMIFFMLIEGPFWVEKVASLIPARRRDETKRIANRMYRIVTGYVFGTLLIAFIAAVGYAIVLTLVGVPNSIPLAVMAGLTVLIPVVGGTVGGLLVTLAALFQSFTTAIIVAIYYIVYQQIENNVLQPLIQRRMVDMSPLLIIIAIIMGTSLAGILGALVAIPVAASAQFLIKELAGKRNRR